MNAQRFCRLATPAQADGFSGILRMEGISTNGGDGSVGIQRDLQSFPRRDGQSPKCRKAILPGGAPRTVATGKFKCVASKLS